MFHVFSPADILCFYPFGTIATVPVAIPFRCTLQNIHIFFEVYPGTFCNDISQSLLAHALGRPEEYLLLIHIYWQDGCFSETAVWLTHHVTPNETQWSEGSRQLHGALLTFVYPDPSESRDWYKVQECITAPAASTAFSLASPHYIPQWMWIFQTMLMLGSRHATTWQSLFGFG